jgi:hypothetical protein
MQNALPSALLDELWRIQKRRGLSDAALARTIGIDPSYLSRLKHTDSRNKRPGGRVVLAILTEFPELAPFLGSDVRIGKAILRERNDAEV